MRKIKRLAHLQKEKKRLRQKGDELENTLRFDWQKICHTLQPVSLAKEALSRGMSWFGKQIFSRQQ